jgi:hypothetical protein
MRISGFPGCNLITHELGKLGRIVDTELMPPHQRFGGEPSAIAGRIAVIVATPIDENAVQHLQVGGRERLFWPVGLGQAMSPVCDRSAIEKKNASQPSEAKAEP